MKKKVFSAIAVLTVLISLSSCGTLGQTLASTALQTAAYAVQPNGVYYPPQRIGGPAGQHPYGYTTQHIPPAVATQQLQQVVSVGLGGYGY